MDNFYTIPVQCKTMDLAGYYIGKKITINPTIKPLDGDCVLINHKSKIHLMEYKTPYLLPRSTDKSQSVIDVGLVDIIGVVINNN